MKLDDFRESDNVEDRRGSGGGGPGIPIGGRGGLGIVGTLVVLGVAYYFGLDPAMVASVVEGVTGSGSGPAVTQQDPAPGGAPADDASSDFVRRVLGSTEDIWSQVLPQQARVNYVKPTLVMYSGYTQSACGGAQSAMGPFYCPNDRKVYLDTEFFDEMRSRFKACPVGEGRCAFAQAYVIAHEIGHHVQNQLGILGKVEQLRGRMDQAASNNLSVRVELQADCLAGVWAANAQERFKFLEQGDIESALQTAQAIGDDMLQKRAQGYVVPDSFTHGSAEQRQRWLTNGLKSGQISSCDTFNAQTL